MRRKLTTVAFLGLAVTCSVWCENAGAQRARARDASPPDFWPVRDNIYMLADVGGNITASVGPDGILLVDTGAEPTSDAVRAALTRLQEQLAFSDTPDGAGAAGRAARLSDNSRAPAKPIRFIVNTSARLEHSGANAVLAAASGNGGVRAAVIAQENVLVRLVSGNAPIERLPTDTFALGDHVLGNAFNGDEIRLVHVPAAVTDGDAIVYFRSADVISTGDVFSMETFPVIDVDSGGSIDGVIGALNTVLSLATSTANGRSRTLIVPGHGRLADSADVGAYRDMLALIRDQMQSAIDAGMTLEQVKAAKPTLDYDPVYGSREGAAERFVEATFQSLTAGGDAR